MSQQPDAYQDALQRYQRGDHRAAEEGLRRLLQTDPRNPRVWLTLGSLCLDQGRLVEAAASFRQAVELSPREAQVHLSLGNVLLKLKNYREAETTYRACLEIQPGLVEALVNLGYSLGEMERQDEAITCYEYARAVAPEIPEVHHNLGNLLREKHRYEEALESYDRSLRLRPDYAKAYVNKGIALAATARVDEALACLRRSVELKPEFAEAHNTLGHAYSAAGRFDDALAEFARAIELNADYADPHWNRSLLWLLLGDFERGWPAVEWRWRCRHTSPLPLLPYPRWDGAPLSGRTILLHAEQGLGDTLHFVRYAPLVKARGGRVIVQCQGALIPLLSRCTGIDELAAWGAPSPKCDVWLPMMSLPGVMKTTRDAIPANVPYLSADPAKIEHWRRELSAIPGFRVGIAWQGSPNHPWDRHRSAPLRAFEPLARVPGVSLVSLQKGFGSEQLESLPWDVTIHRLTDSVDAAGAFTDTAAILQALDLVIVVDTALAHLAGALGIPVWIAIHRTPDWRWMLGRDDSPWYPTVRLFRQEKVAEWGTVFRRIADELAVLAARKSRLPLRVEASAGELLDKLTILRIKLQRISDPTKLENIRCELQALERAWAGVEPSPALAEFERELTAVNGRLWDIEDAIRDHERRQDFGPAFVELARSVYRENDRRAALKRKVNELSGSPLVEEKSYAAY